MQFSEEGSHTHTPRNPGTAPQPSRARPPDAPALALPHTTPRRPLNPTETKSKHSQLYRDLSPNTSKIPRNNLKILRNLRQVLRTRRPNLGPTHRPQTSSRPALHRLHASFALTSRSVNAAASAVEIVDPARQSTNPTAWFVFSKSTNALFDIPQSDRVR